MNPWLPNKTIINIFISQSNNNSIEIKMGSSSSMKIVMALIMYFLVASCAAETTKDFCFNTVEKCPSGQDCNTCCKSTLGYPQGGFALLGICCCQKDSMKV
ncbi:hypothetical protein MKW98_022155 [Papaver atlanticum]|uniref:Uncharacterized protein n=1 Tax=Papaver atlanticum TaxID=357466 RepID=A0AAD4T149_9MAGN|nr:hypothetical protein MKW98_022155 [Papaver atlanticum]